VTLLGITLQPLFRPHISSTCCGDLPFSSAILRSVSFLYSGESVEPRHE
jgi:hypothetical protein